MENVCFVYSQAECQSALARFQEILELAAGRNIALFLDYDGTISQIVNDPDTAYITEQVREVAVGNLHP